MKIKKLVVVGGGTAGFVAALILKSRYTELKIDVIRSSKIGIIGVGEGSTEHWNQFMKYVGISWRDVIKQCDATFKSGIMFKGWSDKDYLHSTNADFEVKTGQYHYVYGKKISEGADQRSITPQLCWQNLLDKSFIESTEPPFNQFHFNTNKLNEFLTKTAISKGIDVIDDEIIDIEIDETLGIKKIIGDNNTYEYDFYLDSTGFKKILISKLGAKWISYSNFLKMNSAIVFPTPAESERNLWTLAQAMKYGWMFKIPVWDRNGNGYIFDKNYIGIEQAKAEVEEVLGRSIEVGKHIEFDPGALDKVWIKNCCAIGLSASFVEPLEASSIGTSIQQTFLLMHRLPNYDQEIIEEYNKAINGILDNIRDFVILHYITNREDTDFWKDVKKMPLPESLEKNLRKWKHNLPIIEDFNNLSNYILFRDTNFIHVLMGLNLFDIEKIKEEYEMQRKEIKNLAARTYEQVIGNEQQAESISHKKFLELIRNYF